MDPSTWFDNIITYQKLCVWLMFIEVFGFGGTFGPLCGHFVPMLGNVRYWLRPGTIRMAPWADRVPGTGGDERTIVDVVLLLAVFASLGYALILPAQPVLNVPEGTPAQELIPPMAFVPILIAMQPGGTTGDGGVVINIASVSAAIAFPAISVYSATKSAVDRFTRVAAMESGKLGYGVRVNSVFPGLVPTAMGAGLASDVASIGLFGSPDEAVAAVIDQTPSGRLGTVEDMADAVVFLASDQAKFINGVGLQVDGGMGM